MKNLRKTLLFLLFVSVAFTACKKSDPYDPAKQLQKEEELIKNYLAANNITAQRHSTGVYYVITEPGTGSVTYTTATNVTVTYSLSLLGGQVIPQPTAPVELTLGGVIAGWQIGVPLIQKGGKIRLFVPSVYAYGQQSQGSIPANSILDFDIDLLDVN
ncbi:FKBP-type peptidyl-prolyl cis-trans isomerase [Pedobacter sp. P351]|uniref:FKBP-type peptidyl-prolyl cis-trans isomerase n=1 Tax=Pedobacter superstes TaxID=3133441 RepID=UPI0030B3227F